MLKNQCDAANDKQMEPFFSIITPAYNVAQFIEETINCINSQSFKNWELIIVDDGSTDATREILAKYEGQENIKIFYSEENSGNPFLVREKALAHASAPYIVMLDADDLVDPDFLQTLYDDLERFSADMVQPVMWRLKGEKCFKILPEECVQTNVEYAGRDLVIHTLDYWRIPIAGFAIKKEIFKEAVRLTHKHNVNSFFSDELMSRYMLVNSPRVVFSDARYIYRENEASVTHQEVQSVKNAYITNQALLDFSENYYGRDSEEFKIAECRQLLYTLKTIKVLNKEKVKKEDEILLKDLIRSTKEKYKNSAAFSRLSLPYRITVAAPMPVAGILFSLISFLRKIKYRIQK